MQNQVYPPAKTFPDILTLLRRHFSAPFTALSRFWFAQQPTLKHRRASLQRQRQKYLDSLISPVQEELDHPHVMGEPWKSPRDLAEQETARIVALQQLEHEKREQTLRIKRYPTKTLLNVYNAEKRCGVPIEERTTAVMRRLSGPLSLRERASLHGYSDVTDQETQVEFPAIALWNAGKAIEKQAPLYIHGIYPLSMLQQPCPSHGGEPESIPLHEEDVDEDEDETTDPRLRSVSFS